MTVSNIGFQFSGKPCLDPSQLVNEFSRLGIDPSQFLGRANSYISPRGSFPGRGWVLLLRSHLTSGFDIDSHEHVLKIVCGTTRIEIRDLLVIGAECLLGGPSPDPNSPYLIEIADLRAIAHMAVINKSYNERFINDFEKDGTVDSWYKSSRNAGSSWTWETMIQNIWGNLPSAVFGSLNTDRASFPTSIPENYNFRGISAWDALNKVLDDISHTIINPPIDDFKIVPLGETDAELENQLKKAKPSIQFNSFSLLSDSLRLPEKVRVYFPNHNYNFQNGSDQNEPTGKDYWRQNPFYTVDKTTTAIIGTDVSPIAGTLLPVHDNTPAMYDDDDTTPNNAATLATRATERATKFLKEIWKSQRYTHNIYSGLHTFEPKSELSAISWYDIGGGMFTEILLHIAPPSRIYQPSFKGRDFNYARENTSPPDIARAHEPTERIILVKLSGALVAGGKATATVQHGTYDTGSDLITWADTHVPHSIVVHEPTGTNQYTTGTLVSAVYHWQSKRWVILTPGLSTYYRVGGLGTNINASSTTAVTAAVTIAEAGIYFVNFYITIIYDRTNAGGLSSWEAFIAYNGVRGVPDQIAVLLPTTIGSTLEDPYSLSAGELHEFAAGDTMQLKVKNNSPDNHLEAFGDMRLSAFRILGTGTFL